MTIDYMSISNFRKFENLDISLKPHMNVIVGNNAAGKTTVLDALAIGLGSFFLGIDGIPSSGIKKTDIRMVSNFVGSVVDRQPQLPVTIECCGVIDKESILWIRSLNSESGNTTYGEANRIKEKASMFQVSIRSGKNDVVLPLISYYGTGRLWAQKKEKQSSEDRRLDSRFNGYTDALSAMSNEKLMISWFRKMTMIQLQEGKELPELKAVRKAIADCCQSGNSSYSEVDVRFNLKTNELEIIFIDENGIKQNQPFHELSDGYKNTLSLVGDIAYRMAVLNPQLLDNVVRQTPGVVLIDEIDQHLHPLWQKTILNSLMNVFPKIQFIVTTHSPTVISSAENSNLILLDNDGCHYYDRDVYGKDVNSVLCEIMGTKYRPDKIDRRIDDFNTCLDNGDYNKARIILDELKELLGENNTDVVNAQIAYDFETFGGGV